MRKLVHVVKEYEIETTECGGYCSLMCQFFKHSDDYMPQPYCKLNSTKEEPIKRDVGKMPKRVDYCLLITVVE